jgi:hypothetical protein
MLACSLLNLSTKATWHKSLGMQPRKNHALAAGFQLDGDDNFIVILCASDGLENLVVNLVKTFRVIQEWTFSSRP